MTAFSSLPNFGHVSVQVMPLAFMTVVDHYMRREEGQEFVLGVIVGHRSEEGGRIVTVRSALPIPYLHSVQDNSNNNNKVYKNESVSTLVVHVDLKYLQTIISLHKKEFEKDLVVGW
jgi:translation initiation factor 3 subunit F